MLMNSEKKSVIYSLLELAIFNGLKVVRMQAVRGLFWAK